MPLYVLYLLSKKHCLEYFCTVWVKNGAHAIFLGFSVYAVSKQRSIEGQWGQTTEKL